MEQSKANTAVTRVGSRVGTVKLIGKTNLSGLSKTTHWFIKSDKGLVNLLKPIKQLNCESVKWVVGPMSLAKPELIKLLNKIQTVDVH